MKSFQTAAVSILVFATALPGFAFAHSAQQAGDATSHIVQPQANTRALHRDVVLMAIEAATGKGQFNTTAGDATPVPQQEPSSKIRMPVADMSRYTTQHMGDAT